MKLVCFSRIGICLTSLAWLLMAVTTSRPQQVHGPAIQITTQERLDSEVWWPRKSNVSIQAFAGSAACTRCHGEGTAGPPSSMQLAAVPANRATFLRATPSLTFSSQPLLYSLTSNQTGIDYSVAHGIHRLSRRLDWVMGAGNLGRTFLYEMDGHWYQSQLSVYTKQPVLDVTTGLSLDPSANLTAALGTVLSPEDTRLCFSCHTVHATTAAGFNPLHAEPGLGCEACHGPGLDHVNTETEAGRTVTADQPAEKANGETIFNPAKLSPADSIDFCGSCHRTFADATLSLGEGTSTAVVRFQPYRLEESKCWRATQDDRLTCVACHDPHHALDRNPASYDSKCLQCHSAVAKVSAAEHAGRVCPKASDRCVSCHMPKVAVESMHGEFTDHFIRVVRAGDGFPR